MGRLKNYYWEALEALEDGEIEIDEENAEFYLGNNITDLSDEEKEEFDRWVLEVEATGEESKKLFGELELKLKIVGGTNGN